MLLETVAGVTAMHASLQKLQPLHAGGQEKGQKTGLFLTVCKVKAKNWNMQIIGLQNQNLNVLIL